MANYTQNYGLHQWEPGDSFLRTDFNGDNQKIDSALSGKCEVVFGTYTGDGMQSRFVELGFTPQAVYLCGKSGTAGSQFNYNGGLALNGYDLEGNAENILKISEGGFFVYQLVRGSYSTETNASGMRYHYLAFR